MLDLPIQEAYSDERLEQLVQDIPGLIFLEHEHRQDFSGDFPLHTRYFSNGDRPLVVLVKRSGSLRFLSEGEPRTVADGEMLLFDDSVPHGWSFGAATVDIFFYRQVAPEQTAASTGDYCIDDFFGEAAD